MNIQAAMDAARFNKGNSRCIVNMEGDYPKEVFEQLALQGHQINVVPRYSLVMDCGNVAMHDDALGVNFGASDPRAYGQAIPEQIPY
jgi:gamma-glutamyltranspeptidase/glutathione hydrolase